MAFFRSMNATVTVRKPENASQELHIVAEGERRTTALAKSDTNYLVLNNPRISLALSASKSRQVCACVCAACPA